MSPYCAEFGDDIRKLAADLIPSADYIRDAKGAAHTIFEKIRQVGISYDIKIARTKVAGSIGKNTGISYVDEDDETVNPDLDLVVFINNVEPPFDYELEIFGDLLEELSEVSNLRVRKHSLMFYFETRSNGAIKVDLLAAKNYVVNPHPYSGQDIGEVEARFALMELNDKQIQFIKQSQKVNQDENKLYSSSFAVKTVKIIRSFVKDSFTRNVVSLAKFWNSYINMGKCGYVPARSSIIELVAIQTQQTRRSARNGQEKCLISGFRRFLEAMSTFSQLDLSLTKENDNGKEGLKNYSKPMIRDPVNKWNNFAEGMPTGAIRIWEQQARKTLKVISGMRSRDDYNDVEDAIDAIFEHKD